MLTLVKKLVREEEGQTMAEYALILVLIAVVVIGALTDIGTNIMAVFNAIKSKLVLSGG
ncbi:MAG: Flp family type IVb pilin [bacterium]|jgi:pilus assembly protein Flp/PilA|nr:Flp family type IVb pilin [Bacillota bacterium]